MRYVFAVVSIFLTAIPFCTTGFAEKRPEVGKYPTYYEGNFEDKRIRVTIVRIGSRESEEVLVQVKGYDHKLDGYIVKCKKKWLVKQKDTFYYSTSEYPGLDNWNVFYKEQSWGSYYQKIFPPGIKKEVLVYPVEGGDGAELLLTDYLNQKKK